MKYINIVLLFIVSIPAFNQDLERRGIWGATVTYCEEGKGLCVTNVEKNGSADKANLQDGDVITEINSERVNDYITSANLLRSLKSGRKINLLINRNGSTSKSIIILDPLPLDTYPGVDFEYGSIVSPQGYKLRTVISKPQNSKGKLPTIFYIKWLACSAVEGRDVGFIRVVWELSKAGYLVYRIEVPGAGDSEGVCSGLDFKSEVELYKAAFQTIKNIKGADINNVFIYGVNSGGVLAPMIATNNDEIAIKGIIVNGTWVRTWFEHILDQERRVLEYLDVPREEISERMNRSAEFNAEYLIKGGNPSNIIRANPHLTEEWNHPSFNHHFGDRPIEYFQQMNHQDIAGYWNKITVPTLVIYNEFDWMIAKKDHQLIYDIVESNNPGMNKMVVVPRTDHVNYIYREGDKKASFLTSSSEVNPQSWEVIINWAGKIVKH